MVNIIKGFPRLTSKSNKRTKIICPGIQSSKITLYTVKHYETWNMFPTTNKTIKKSVISEFIVTSVFSFVVTIIIKESEFTRNKKREYYPYYHCSDL